MVITLVCQAGNAGSIPVSSANFKIPLSSVVERSAVNREALVRYSDDRNVEGEPISNASIAE